MNGATNDRRGGFVTATLAGTAVLSLAVGIPLGGAVAADQLVLPEVVTQTRPLEAAYRLDKPATGRGFLDIEWSDVDGRVVERRRIPLAYQYWAGFGLDAVRVRIFNCTGPRKVGDALSDFVRRIVWLERHPEVNVIRVGNLETRRTIVDVRDLNRGLILLLDRGKSGEVYNLGGPTAYPMSAVLSWVLQRATRSDIVPEVDPKLLRPTDEPIIWADCTKLKLATGWEPAVPLEQTIDDMLSYWRQKPERALVV